jgi:hypothetical protein
MMQRKLTDEELQVVMDARSHVRQVAKFSAHAAHFHESLRRLDEMASNGTTDGKPYVDPEPPIPDGYRRAVQGDETAKMCNGGFPSGRKVSRLRIMVCWISF